MRKFRTEIVVMQNIHQEVSQLIDVVFEFFHIEVIGGIEKQLGITLFDKSDTGGRRTDHRVVNTKLFKEFIAQGLGVFHITGVIGKASAAGLIGIIVYFNASLLKDLDGVHGRFGIKLVDGAGNKQINCHGYSK